MVPEVSIGKYLSGLKLLSQRFAVYYTPNTN